MRISPTVIFCWRRMDAMFRTAIHTIPRGDTRTLGFGVDASLPQEEVVVPRQRLAPGSSLGGKHESCRIGRWPGDSRAVGRECSDDRSIGQGCDRYIERTQLRGGL